MNNQRLKDCIEQELNFIQPDVERGWREIQDKAHEKKKRHIYQIRPVIVMAILLIIIVIPVGSTAAYELFQRTYHLPIGKQKTTNEDILMTDNVVTVEQNREQNALFENIEIEWTGSYVKDELAIISFRMKTVDGTPLIKDEENKAPILYPLTFEEIFVSGNGKTKLFEGYILPYELIPEDYYIGCTWISEDLSSAEFELKLQNGIFDIQNNDITIQFKNMLGIFHGFTDMNTTGTLGEILSTEAPGEGLHILFSEDYPECYIDSYGFVSDETYENIEEILHIIPTGKKIFTMTVVCDEESKETIRQMVFQNANTGFCANAEMPVRELEDGRLQFYYSVNYDGSYVNKTYESRGGEKRDTTMEDLQQLVLKLGGERVIETLLEGTIEEVISID